MRLGDLEVMHGVGIKIKMMLQPGSRQHLHQKMIDMLEIIGEWLQSRLVETVVNRRGVEINRAMDDFKLHSETSKPGNTIEYLDAEEPRPFQRRP